MIRPERVGPENLPSNMGEHLPAQVLCPLCRSGEIRRVKLIDVAPAIALWRQFFQIDITPEFQGVSQMELFRCVSCSISFFTPPCLAGSPQIYSQLANYGGYYLAQKWEYDAALADLRGRERVLEVGCERVYLSKG